jgi:hypothetical protein
VVGLPLPATRCSEWTQSTVSSRSKGSQRSWLGMKWIFSYGLFSGFVLKVLDSRGSKLECPHEGRMR